MKRNRVVLISLAALVIAPGTAHAAAKPGSYSGVSRASIFKDPQQAEPITDKGKVTFRVSGGNVLDFRLKGQKFQCGPGHAEVPVKVRTIKLGSSGKGTATYSNSILGRFKIAIKVTSRGAASGTVKPKGLCNDDYPARFTARR